MSALAQAPLACPVCAGPLRQAGPAMGCEHGHSFDIARHGYVNLAPAGSARGDDADMVAARAQFLQRGWFGPLTEALAQAGSAAATAPGVLADLGAGTGHHLAALLDAAPDRDGVALDASVYAARRAARAHPRAAAVVADAWHGLPLLDDSVAVALVAFAPRAGAQIARVLAPGGTLVVAVPAPRHLAELVEPLGLLAVDPRKEERLRDALAPGLERAGEQAVEWTMDLDRDSARALAAMGPAARHAPAGELERRVGQLPDPVRVTGAVLVSCWRAP